MVHLYLFVEQHLRYFHGDTGGSRRGESFLLNQDVDKKPAMYTYDKEELCHLAALMPLVGSREQGFPRSDRRRRVIVQRALDTAQLEALEKEQLAVGSAKFRAQLKYGGTGASKTAPAEDSDKGAAGAGASGPAAPEQGLSQTTSSTQVPDSVSVSEDADAPPTRMSSRERTASPERTTSHGSAATSSSCPPGGAPPASSTSTPSPLLSRLSPDEFDPAYVADDPGAATRAICLLDIRTVEKIEKETLLAVAKRELPPRDWADCSDQVKVEALRLALKAGNCMHIVDAFQPEAEIFRQGVKAVEFGEELAVAMMAELLHGVSGGVFDAAIQAERAADADRWETNKSAERSGGGIILGDVGAVEELLGGAERDSVMCEDHKDVRISVDVSARTSEHVKTMRSKGKARGGANSSYQDGEMRLEVSAHRLNSLSWCFQRAPSGIHTFLFSTLSERAHPQFLSFIRCLGWMYRRRLKTDSTTVLDEDINHDTHAIVEKLLALLLDGWEPELIENDSDDDLADDIEDDWYGVTGVNPVELFIQRSMEEGAVSNSYALLLDEDAVDFGDGRGSRPRGGQREKRGHGAKRTRRGGKRTGRTRTSVAGDERSRRSLAGNEDGSGGRGEQHYGGGNEFALLAGDNSSDEEEDATGEDSTNKGEDGGTQQPVRWISRRRKLTMQTTILKTLEQIGAFPAVFERRFFDVVALLEQDENDVFGSLGAQAGTTLGVCIPLEKFRTTLRVVIAPEASLDDPRDDAAQAQTNDCDRSYDERRRAFFEKPPSRTAKARALFGLRVLLLQRSSYEQRSRYAAGRVDDDEKIAEIATWLALQFGGQLQLPALEVLETLVAGCGRPLPDTVMLLLEELCDSAAEEDVRELAERVRSEHERVMLRVIGLGGDEDAGN